VKTKTQAKGTYWSRILTLVTVVLATLACSFIETPTPTTRSTSAPTRTPIPTWTPIPSATPTPKPTTGEISGQVIDSASNSPIPNANVTTDPPTVSVTADAQGRYVISEIPPGVYTITATKPGYTSASVSISVTAGKTTAADVHLMAMPSPTPQTSLTDGLVVYYPFNGNADDESGNGNHGTTHGATLVDDRFGNPDQAYEFDGTNDYIQAPTDILYHNEFAQSLWIWISPSQPEVLQKHILQTGNGGIYYLPMENNFRIDIYHFRDGGLKGPGSATRYYYDFPADGIEGTWNHIVLIGFSDNTAKFFVNGAQVPTGERITDRGVTGDYNATVLGATMNTRTGNIDGNFAGRIDDVHIYNRTLSEAEIQALYRESEDAGLVAYYPFNGNADDESGNGNHGVVHGATLTTDRFGSEESAYRFDGINDYIEIADSPSLDIEQQITIAAWVRFYSNPDGSSRIVDKSHTDCRAPWNMYGLRMCCKASRFSFDVTTYGSNHISNSTSDYPPDAWHFVIGTYDGSAQKLYVDGVLDSSAAVSGPIETNNEPLLIGKHRGCESQHFDGVLDDVRIYNRALSEAEIGGLYEEGG
jgi:hypothetical protein